MTPNQAHPSLRHHVTALPDRASLRRLGTLCLFTHPSSSSGAHTNMHMLSYLANTYLS